MAKYLFILFLYTPQLWAMDLASTTSFGYTQTQYEQPLLDLQGGTFLGLGALVFLKHDLVLSLETVGSGSKNGNWELYRISSGPRLGWKVIPGYEIFAGMSFFTESGLREQRRMMSAKGEALEVGWRRSIPVGKSLSLDWGATLSRFWGTAHWTGDVLTGQSSHNGFTRSLIVSMKMTLR